MVGDGLDRFLDAGGVQDWYSFGEGAVYVFEVPVELEQGRGNHCYVSIWGFHVANVPEGEERLLGLADQDGAVGHCVEDALGVQ